MPGRRDHSRQLLEFSREMRRESTDAERKLWSLLRGKQLDGFRFRRQFPVAGYIVDFLCLQANLGVEADGGQHLTTTGQKRDQRRDAAIAAHGIRVLRFSDIDILKTPEIVAKAILDELTKSVLDQQGNEPMASSDEPPPQPSPGVPEEGAGEELLFKALLASDLAVEVKAEFDGRIAVGFDVPAATQHVFARFRNALSSPHDGPVVLLALAALQMREGYLQSVIRDAAIDLIQSGEAMAAYRTEDWQTRGSRREILDAFAGALEAAAVRE